MIAAWKIRMGNIKWMINGLKFSQLIPISISKLLVAISELPNPSIIRKILNGTFSFSIKGARSAATSSSNIKNRKALTLSITT
jgi:hypothetical protein